MDAMLKRAMYSRSESHKAQAAPNNVPDETKSHSNAEGAVSHPEAENNLPKTEGEAKTVDSQGQAADAPPADTNQRFSSREKKYREILQQHAVDIGISCTHCSAGRTSTENWCVLVDDCLQKC